MALAGNYGAANAFNLVHSLSAPTDLGRKSRIFRYSITRNEVSVFSYVAIRDSSIFVPLVRGVRPSWSTVVVSRHSPRLPHQVQKGLNTVIAVTESRDKTARPFQFSAWGEDKEALRRGSRPFRLCGFYLCSLLAHRDWGGSISARLTPAHSFELLLLFSDDDLPSSVCPYGAVPCESANCYAFSPSKQ